MDFGALPPDINSGRMYIGPGSGPMLAAASAWDGLAAQLHSATASYESVISNLTSGWHGPSSMAMAAAAVPYVEWMSAAAGQAEQAASQARSAAAAYETAFMTTVPPEEIAENRSRLASLVATNVLGQNTAAIAAAEAEYGQMWAQDAAAMYGYAGSSALASQMMPFSPPPQTTNPGAVVGQSSAVAQAATAAPANAQSTLSQLMSATPQTLQSFASPAAAPAADPSSLATFLNNLNSTPLARIAANIEFVTKSIRPVNDTLLSTSLGLVITARTWSDTAVELEGPLFAALGSSTHAAGAAGGAAVSASVGSAGLAGGLSVPPSWAVASPGVKLAATVLECTSAGAAPTVAATMSGFSGEMALAGLAGGALGSAVPRAVTASAVRGLSRRSSDNDGKTPDKLKAVLAELQEAPGLRPAEWCTSRA